MATQRIYDTLRPSTRTDIYPPPQHVDSPGPTTGGLAGRSWPVSTGAMQDAGCELPRTPFFPRSTLNRARLRPDAPPIVAATTSLLPHAASTLLRNSRITAESSSGASSAA